MEAGSVGPKRAPRCGRIAKKNANHTTKEIPMVEKNDVAAVLELIPEDSKYDYDEIVKVYNSAK